MSWVLYDDLRRLRQQERRVVHAAYDFVLATGATPLAGLRRFNRFSAISGREGLTLREMAFLVAMFARGGGR